MDIWNWLGYSETFIDTCDMDLSKECRAVGCHLAPYRCSGSFVCPLFFLAHCVVCYAERYK